MLERLREKLIRKQVVLYGRLRRAKYDEYSSGSLDKTMLILQDHSKQQIEEIEEALQRMEVGSYGLCEECGKPIRVERLKVMPTASTCIHCQKKLERT